MRPLYLIALIALPFPALATEGVVSRMDVKTNVQQTEDHRGAPVERLILADPDLQDDSQNQIQRLPEGVPQNAAQTIPRGSAPVQRPLPTTRP